MKRLLALALLALPAWGQVNVTTSPCNMTDGSCAGSGSSIPVACNTAGMIPLFLGSPLAMDCDASLTFNGTSDALSVGASGSVRTPTLHLYSANDPTGTDYSKITGTGDSVVVQAAGSKIFAVEGAETIPGHSKGIRLAGTASLSWVNGPSPESEEPDTGFHRRGTRSVSFGTYYTGTPNAQNFLIGDWASGTNIAGKIQTLTAAPGTGTGIGSALYIYTSTPYGVSNNWDHAQGLRMTIDGAQIGFNVPTWTVNQFPGSNDWYKIGDASYAYKNIWLTQGVIGSKTKNLTSGVAATFATFPLAGYKTGEITYHVVASRFSALQVRKGRVQFAATYDNSAYSCTATEMGASAMAGAGTLTGQIECTCAAGACTLTFTYTSSLTTPGMTANYRFDNLEDIVPTIVP